MNFEELTNLENEELVKRYKRAIELTSKGSSKGPFDINQLEQELLRRMKDYVRPWLVELSATMP
jgi:hypothetical protein